MPKFEAPKEVIQGLSDVREQLTAAKQVLGQLAASFSPGEYPEMAASLRLVAGTVSGATMMADDHLGRYVTAANGNQMLSTELEGTSASEASANAMRSYMENIRKSDPSRTPSRSRSVGRAAARMTAPRANHGGRS